MAAMESFDFTLMKVPALQDFLKIRGVTVSGINRPKLVELCHAVRELNLPADPDYITDRCSNTTEFQKFGIDNLLSLDGFSSDLSNIPSFSLYDIFNYLLYKSSNYDRKKLKAYKSCEEYRLFYDGYVEDLQFKDSDPDVCIFKARVKPTQKDTTYHHKSTYDLWIVMGKQNGDVKTAYCTCIGGADGACRHIGATLYEIEAFEVKSVTDGDNTWTKRPREHDCPVPIKKMKLLKAKYTTVQDQTPDMHDFDPRPLDQRQNYSEDRLFEIAEELRKISPSTQILDVLENPDKAMDTVTVPDPDPEIISRCKNLSVMSNIEQYMSHHESVSADDFIENLTISNSEVEFVDEYTMGQANNQLWHEMRRGMITASNFSKVCRAVDSDKAPPSLLKTLLCEYNTDRLSMVPSLQWGRKKEKNCFEFI